MNYIIPLLVASRTSKGRGVLVLAVVVVCNSMLDENVQDMHILES